MLLATAAGNVTVNADTAADGTGTFTTVSTFNAGTTDVSITAADAVIGGDITGATITLAATNGRQIDFGDGAGGADEFDLTSTEVGDLVESTAINLDTTGNVFAPIAVSAVALDIDAADVTFSNTVTSTTGNIVITNTGTLAINNTVTSAALTTLDGTGGITLGGNISSADAVNVSTSRITLTGDRSISTTNSNITLDEVITDTDMITSYPLLPVLVISSLMIIMALQVSVIRFVV